MSVTGPHGWLILDKPLGLGSTQAVGAVKRALREAGYGKAKVGHGGTLDPLASGVLPVAIGEATKLAGRMLDSDKIYDFTVTFGKETDTLDLEGTEISTSDVRPTARGGRGRPAALHRSYRAGTAGLQRDQDRRPACLRPREGRRGCRDEEKGGDNPRPEHVGEQCR